MRQSEAHGECENRQLEKSQKLQEQNFCRCLLLCIEASAISTSICHKKTDRLVGVSLSGHFVQCVKH